jgi:hypothetical protein
METNKNLNMTKVKVDELTIDGTVYVPKDSVQKMAESCSGLKAVLIRSVHSGVHFGFLEKEEYTAAGKVVILRKARRVWYWKGAASLSQMAVEGVNCPSECKFAMEVDSIEVVNVIETLPLTHNALINLQSVSVWKK